MRDGIIAEIGDIPQPETARTVDCTGLAAAPGSIDIHSHSDSQVLANHRAKADQGVTTEVVGNCGFSPYPFRHNHEDLHQLADGIFSGRDDWGWSGARDYLDEVHRRAKLAKVLSLTGHASLNLPPRSNRGQRDTRKSGTGAGRR